jgi:hypothetical protein
MGSTTVLPAKCAACQLGKRRKEGSKTIKPPGGVLKMGKLEPDDLVFSDQYGPSPHAVLSSTHIHGDARSMCSNPDLRMETSYLSSGTLGHNKHNIWVLPRAPPLHASTVALVRNLRTNKISPQFHVVFDDLFGTVHASASGPPPPRLNLSLSTVSSPTLMMTTLFQPYPMNG